MIVYKFMSKKEGLSPEDCWVLSPCSFV